MVWVFKLFVGWLVRGGVDDIFGGVWKLVDWWMVGEL